MAVNFEALIGLWTRALPEGSAAEELFGKTYADPVMVNGVSLPLSALVERARATQKAFADLEAELLARSDSPTHCTIVFRMRGRHVGPLTTPLGVVEATGKVVERQIIDLLRLRDGLIDEVWMVGDELGALIQLRAITRA